MTSSHIVTVLWLCLSTFTCMAAACTKTTNLTEPEGLVSSPVNEFGLGYPSNIDHCWVIRTSRAVEIDFTKLEVESCCDKVFIYEKSETPRNSSLRFTLSDYIGTQHVMYWMTGTTLIRFKTDASIEKTGFEFKYRAMPLFRVPETDFGIAAEMINVTKGTVGRGLYSPTLQHVWSIHAFASQLVIVEFKSLVEYNDEQLLIFPGIATKLKHRPLLSLTSLKSLKNMNSTFYFLGSITIVHKTQGRSYFLFDFLVSEKSLVYQPLQKWSGKAMQGAAFNFRIHPAFSLVSLDQACRLEFQCLADPITIQVANFSFDQSLTVYHFSIPNYAATGSCVSGVTCKTKSTGLSLSNYEIHLEFPTLNPESVSIESLQLELLSQTVVLQFQAVSNSTCPSVEHYCEFRTANGSSLPAQRVNYQISRSQESLQCHSSVTTQFALVTQVPLISGSVVACRLLNGSFVSHPLPLFNASSNRYNRWSSNKHPSSTALTLPQLVTPVTAVSVLFAVLCGVVFVLIVRLRSQQKPRKPVTPAVRMTTLNPTFQTSEATCYEYPEYTSTRTVQHSDATCYEYAENESSNIAGVYVG